MEKWRLPFSPQTLAFWFPIQQSKSFQEASWGSEHLQIPIQEADFQHARKSYVTEFWVNRLPACQVWALLCRCIDTGNRLPACQVLISKLSLQSSKSFLRNKVGELSRKLAYFSFTGVTNIIMYKRFPRGMWRPSENEAVPIHASASKKELPGKLGTRQETMYSIYFKGCR